MNNENIIIIVLIIIIVFLIIKKEKSNDYKKLSDMDMYHYKKKHKAYIVVKFFFKNLKNGYKFIINNIKYLIKNREKYNLSLLMYEKKLYNKNYVKKINLSDKKIFNEFILHNYIAKNNKDMIYKTYKSLLFGAISIDLKNNSILMCWNHAIADGYRASINFIQKLLFGINNNIENTKLININYTSCCYSICKLIYNYNLFYKFKKKNIKKDISNITFNFKLNVNFIKKKIKKKSNFNSTLQEIILNLLYPNLNKENFLCGVIFATNLKNSFNGLGIIPYFTDFKNKNNISIEINKKIKNNYYLGVSSIILNKKFYNLEINFDIIFSGIKLTDRNNIYNDSEIIDFYTYMPYHKAPIYIFTFKIDDYIHVSIGVKNKKLKNFLKETYNWSYIDE